MAISVIDPIRQAFNRTRWILFQPFDLGKWLILGFCAWLASLGEGGTDFNFNGFGDNSSNGNGPDGQRFHDEVINPAITWVTANMALVIALAASVVVLVIGFTLLLTWLQSRGKFMFLDGVAWNRAAVVEPWRRLRRLGNSLFWFRFITGLIFLFVTLGIVLGAAALAWPDIRAWSFGPNSIMALIFGSLAFVACILVWAVVIWMTEDFVIPAMYIRQAGVMEAWRVVWREILKVHPGPVALFGLMRIVVGICAGIAILLYVILGACVTCCLALCLFMLPYLGTIMILPVPVFMRSYSLYFIQQFGDSWRTIATEPADLWVADGPPRASEWPPPAPSGQA
jgi:hypothetical protein